MNAESIQQRSTQGRRGEVHNGIHNCLFLSFSTFIICTWTFYDALYIPCNEYLWEHKGATRKYLILSMASFYLFLTYLVWGEEALWGIAQ